MTVYKEFYYRSSDGKTRIHANLWTPKKVTGVVQIAHGIAEYGKRYAPFAQYLCDNGFAVVANDHLGHGESISDGSKPLYFCEQDGWTKVVDDMEKLRALTEQEFPNVPYFLFGHSMGSFLSRTYLIRYPGNLTGCILCGTGNPSGISLLAGKAVVAREMKRIGKNGYSKLADDLIFGSYNQRFAPNRTQVDWLSANEANVDAYIQDPLCGGQITIGLMHDLLEGLWFITRKRNLPLMDDRMPVLFIAGENDPVGNMGRDVRKVYQNFQEAGMNQADIWLYEGLRHEILNEETNTIIYSDILAWLQMHQSFRSEQGDGV